MSALRKPSAVLRLLRGEDLELMSRELAVPAVEAEVKIEHLEAGHPLPRRRSRR